MAFQLSVAVRNAQLDEYEAQHGASAKLELRTGAQPANCAAADAGTLLVDMTLPADWMAPAAGGSVSKQGTWQANAIAAGVIAHFRTKDNAGTTCHSQGSVTGSGGGGQMELNNVNVADTQSVTILTYTLDQGNA